MLNLDSFSHESALCSELFIPVRCRLDLPRSVKDFRWGDTSIIPGYARGVLYIPSSLTTGVTLLEKLFHESTDWGSFVHFKCCLAVEWSNALSLGHLLFFIYISDLPASIISRCYLVADFSKRICPSENTATLIEDLRQAVIWTDNWGMQLAKFQHLPQSSEVVPVLNKPDNIGGLSLPPRVNQVWRSLLSKCTMQYRRPARI